MSTQAPVQTAAPGTPGSEPTPIAPSAKSMIADAFKSAPTETPVVVPPVTAKPDVVPAIKPDAMPAAKTDAPPVKTDAKPASPVLPEDRLEIPANASPEAVKNFKAYKESMKSILEEERKTRTALEQKLAVHSSATPASDAEQQAKEARLKAAEDRLAILDLQSHPDFAKQFVEPKKKALAVAAEVIQYNDKPVPELASLLSKPMKEFNAAVSEFTKDMNSADAATVATSLREARGLHAAEQGALGQANELLAQLQQKTALEQKRAFEAVTTEVTSALTKREITPDLSADDREAAMAYNQAVEGMRANAEKKAFGRVSERDVAKMAYESETLALMRSHVMPGLERHVETQNKVIIELKAQLEAVKGARSPNPGGDKPAAPAAKTTQQMVAEAFKR